MVRQEPHSKKKDLVRKTYKVFFCGTHLSINLSPISFFSVLNFGQKSEKKRERSYYHKFSDIQSPDKFRSKKLIVFPLLY